MRERWLIAGLAVALLLAGIFVARAVNMGRRAHSGVENIRPWMSVPYLAHSRHVPQIVLWKALGMTPHGHDRRPIGRIAHELQIPADDAIAKLQAAIDEAQKHPEAKP
jgi:hypothetical protein